MRETILKIEGLKAQYGEVKALRGIDLTVKKGQVVTLLGGNGAGKSTTLKAISGLIRATQGTIEFVGEEITRVPAHQLVSKGLIHVPEGRRIFKGMTVRENLDLSSFTLKDDSVREHRRQHVFSLFPILEERQSMDSAMLSGGEQQMLAMGRALMNAPRLLLLDEPSMGLAPALVQKIMRIIRQLNQEGTTILLVEQNAKVALSLADYGYVLETGNIVIKGSGESLRKDERVVKAYLGG